MNLSNVLAKVLIFLPFALVLQGCGGTGTGTAPDEKAIIESNDVTPFRQTEPTEFQASIVTSDGTKETRAFYAKKGANWRYDSYSDGVLVGSLISNGTVASVRHGTKVYTELSGEGFQHLPDPIAEMTSGLVRSRINSNFEKIGATGNITRYRATVDGAESSVILDYDEGLGQIVRQEVRDQGSGAVFVIELRDISVNVDDSVFVIPQDYKKLTLPDLIKNQHKWN